MITPLNRFGELSESARNDNALREIHSLRADVTNLQRRLTNQMADAVPAESTTGSGGAFDWATLTATLSRGGTASATLSDSTAITVNDDGDQLPGTIAIPSGKKVMVGQNAAGDWQLASAPAWCFKLRGTTPGSAITAGNTGTVALANSMGNVTARNRWTTSTATSRTCFVVWEEQAGTPEWVIAVEDC